MLSLRALTSARPRRSPVRCAAVRRCCGLPSGIWPGPDTGLRAWPDTREALRRFAVVPRSNGNLPVCGPPARLALCAVRRDGARVQAGPCRMPARHGPTGAEPTPDPHGRRAPAPARGHGLRTAFIKRASEGQPRTIGRLQPHKAMTWPPHRTLAARDVVTLVSAAKLRRGTT
jgi:hypothetical protein